MINNDDKIDLRIEINDIINLGETHLDWADGNYSDAKRTIEQMIKELHSLIRDNLTTTN